MNAPIRAMSETLDLHWNTRAERLIHDGTHWCAITGDARYCAETLLIAIPAEQASALLHEAAPDLAAVADAVTSQPCWAVMAAFAEPVALAVDAVRNADAAVAWAARNSAKPGRGGTECWVLHASPARSHELLDLSAPEVGTMLLADFFAQTGAAPVEPIHLAAHRWLYAMPGPVAGEAARYDAIHRIGIAGDYLHSPRVEGAFVSGNLLAQSVLAAA
jgi:predicted NAD/FAD-dependent oxidoreductase